MGHQHTPLSESTWFKIETRTTPKYQDSGRKWGSPQCNAMFKENITKDTFKESESECKMVV